MSMAQVLLIVYIATPVACWCLNALLGKRRLHWAILFVVTGICGYVALLAAVQATELGLNAEVRKHDIDGDGAFSDDEMTPEAKRAMEELTNDTGRALAPITGIPITFIWTSLNFMVLGIVQFVGSRLLAQIRRKPKEVDPRITPQPASARIDSSNPYEPPSQ